MLWCARFPAVVHVSQKLCVCHRSCARLTSPLITFVFNCIHTERIRIIKSIGATKHVLPCCLYTYIYILDYPHSLCCIKISWKIPWTITIFSMGFFSPWNPEPHRNPPKNFAPGRSWPDPATDTPIPTDPSENRESVGIRTILTVDFTMKNVTKCDKMWMISAYFRIFPHIYIYTYINISCEWSPYLLFFFYRLNMTSHDG